MPAVSEEGVERRAYQSCTFAGIKVDLLFYPDVRGEVP